MVLAPTLYVHILVTGYNLNNFTPPSYKDIKVYHEKIIISIYKKKGIFF